jgi:enterobactin synthetase component D
MAFTVVWQHRAEHGLCLAVDLPATPGNIPGDALARLHPAERTRAEQLPPRRRATWVGGRLALRAALDELGVRCGPVLATPRGGPDVPPGITASIAHKQALLAVALVHNTLRGATVGVDLEPERPCREGIERLVLTDAEQQQVAALPPERRWPEVLLRFSLKEAVYKALDPWVRRYVGFDEVEVQPAPDGTAAVRLHLRDGEGPFTVEACWWRHEPRLLLTTARIRSLSR